MTNQDFLIKTWVCGPLEVNCYLAGSLAEKEVVLIDPGGASEEITSFLEQKGIIPRLIILTHGHLDHILAIPDLLRKWDVNVACHPEEIPFIEDPDPYITGFLGQGYESFKPNYILNDGDKIQIGPNTMEVIHTPGHSPGSICLLCPPFLFSGDTLFKCGVGRTDFNGGNYQALIHSIKHRLYPLPDELILLPGHGGVSLLGAEKGVAIY